ncbi:hypothetical protein VTI74DRAFT_10371 [Chaetomium olivicolor]
MPFLFSYVCDLLQRLEDNRLARSGLKSNVTIIQEWFRGHQVLLHRDDHNSAALLSALLPEKRTDRIYFIREKKLQAIIGRALGLGRSRIAELGRWSNPEASADLAECVESILRQTPNPISPTHRPVTVEEIDDLLHSIAATCRFSSPAVRNSACENRSADRELSLGRFYQRLSARDAKWLTRLILKNYEPIVLDQHAVCAGHHPLLPAILRVQDDLAVAGRILDTLRRDRTVTGQSELAGYLKPTLGVKIGRQNWIKGRSIKHCLSMLQGRISCEEKMDGEYCQIHIDLSKGQDCIQIFSKSGKDSTKDRRALHDSIRKSLQLGQPSCPLKSGCILEGELVVYSDKHSKILDFHKIRKHVSRSGWFLGTDQDSQPHPWEHLMIIYYDALMIDSESLLTVKHSERFERLKSLITPVPGRSTLVKREVIDCSRRSAISDLRRALAKCITERGEGLVLKADDPYFDFSTLRRPYSCCTIKLKKEYIAQFGDIGDFAVIGARYDAAKARTYNIPRLKWTHFYVGCLENKEEVRRFGKQPHFVVTNVVELNATQLEAFMFSVNPEPVQPEDNTAISLRIEPGIDGGKQPSVIFPAPPVFDIRCFSFDKEGNTGFWSPRFASVSKIHCDRTYHDVVSFAELQEMAAKEKETPPPDDSQELLGWIAALERSESKTTVDTTSQSTVSTATANMTPSPQRPATNEGQSLVTPASPIKMKVDLPAGSCAAPVAGRLMPWRAFASQAAELTSSNKSGKQDCEGLARKRPVESSTQESIPERTKRRCSGEQLLSTAPSAENINPNLSNNRRELPMDVRLGLSRRNTAAELPMPRLSCPVSMHQASSNTGQPGDGETSRPSMQTSVSFHGGHSTSFSARPSTAHSTSPSAETDNGGPQTSETETATTTDTTKGAKCRFLPDECKFPTYSILLSPCIADFPWVTEDLLSCHGATEFLRDPKEWLNDRSTSSTQIPSSTSTPAPSSPSTTNRCTIQKTKIVLVDARRREATAAFLQSIEAVQLRRRNGEREYVPVYDWRALEAVKEEEQRCGRNRHKPGRTLDLNSSRSLWRPFWVGLA